MFNTNSYGVFVFIFSFSRLLDTEIFRFISQRYWLSENTAQNRQGHTVSDWKQKELVDLLHYRRQSTWKLILHQVSSIFWGSGSLGRYSLDTRKMVCTSMPRGGLYGKKHLHSLPASHLQTETYVLYYQPLSVSFSLSVNTIIWKFKGYFTWATKIKHEMSYVVRHVKNFC